MILEERRLIGVMESSIFIENDFCGAFTGAWSCDKNGEKVEINLDVSNDVLKLLRASRKYKTPVTVRVYTPHGSLTATGVCTYASHICRATVTAPMLTQENYV